MIFKKIDLIFSVKFLSTASGLIIERVRSISLIIFSTSWFNNLTPKPVAPPEFKSSRH